MAARDRWSIDLKCPNCGKTGTADISEEDHPWVRGDIGRTIDFLSDGFGSYNPGTNSVQQRINCATCKVDVWPGNAGSATETPSS
jgi:hypothetical protein